jgi:hypothetical protein
MTFRMPEMGVSVKAVPEAAAPPIVAGAGILAPPAAAAAGADVVGAFSKSLEVIDPPKPDPDPSVYITNEILI